MLEKVEGGGFTAYDNNDGVVVDGEACAKFKAMPISILVRSNWEAPPEQNSGRALYT